MVSSKRRLTRRQLLGAGLGLAAATALAKVGYEKYINRPKYQTKFRYARRDPDKPFKPLTIFGVHHDDAEHCISETLRSLERNKNSFETLGLEVPQNTIGHFKWLEKHPYHSDGSLPFDVARVGGTVAKGDDYLGSDFFYQIYLWAMKNGKNVEAIDPNWQMVDDPHKSIGASNSLRYERMKKILEKQGLNPTEARYWIEAAFHEERLASNIKRKNVDAIVVGAWHAEEMSNRFPTKLIVYPETDNIPPREAKDSREAYKLRKKKKAEELKKKGFRN